MTDSLLPPSYVNSPKTTIYAYDVDDALIVTMERIRGLCWQYDYKRTPALAPGELAQATGRSRSTLYRHLEKLERLSWVQTQTTGRRKIIRPLVRIAPNGQIVPNSECDLAPSADLAGEPGNRELLHALAAIGIENPKRRQLARLDIDPAWVHGWYLWARHPHRASLTNPVGNVIRKLERGEKPPGEFLKEAVRQLRRERQVLDGDTTRPAEELEEPGLHGEPRTETTEITSQARELWTAALDELQLQMTRATYDTWLRGSRVVAAGDEHLTIYVRHAYAVDWLQNRLLHVVERAVARHAGRHVAITFTAHLERILDEESQAAQSDPGN